MILKNKTSGETTAIQQNVFTAGSSPVNNLALQGENIRKIHFQILRQAGLYRLLAMNGTVEINGEPMAEHVLATGDEIRIGSHAFEALAVEAKPAGKASAGAEADSGDSDAEQDLYELLLDRVIALLENPDKHQSTREILSFCRELMNADGGYLFSLENGSPSLLHSIPMDNPLFSNSAVNAALKSQRTLVYSASESHEEVSAHSIAQKQIYSVMVSPLRNGAEAQVKGLLYLHRRESREPFSEADCRLFERVGRVLGAVLGTNQVQIEQAERIETLRSVQKAGDFIHACEALKKVVEEARRAAASEAPVLLTGEPGTGKDALAAFIHQHSSRSEGPFIALDCGAVPEASLEAELFGVERGPAGPGQRGLFDQADGGTLLLNAVQEIPSALQLRLLGRMQEGGGRVRVIAATTLSPSALLGEGGLREDLFYQLNLFHLHLPALRDREGDILLLANHVLRKACSRFNMNLATLTKAAEKGLLKYNWPGNIRELENRLQKALLHSTSRVIDVGALDLPAEQAELLSLKQVREEAETRAIHTALTKARGNLTLAASFLGIDRKVLRDIMERLEIDKSLFKESKDR